MAKDEIKILGAGLSGLTAAINLAKAGKTVRVFEKRRRVGEQIFPNFQGLIKMNGLGDYSGRVSVSDYFGRLGLRPRGFEHVELSKVRFLTRNRSIRLSSKKKYAFIQRGGRGSLEHSLFSQAMSLGVKFEFNSRLPETRTNVVASGPKRADVAAFGAVFEHNALDDGEFLMMFDDRYSPKGWYLYALPHLNGGMEIVNCAPQPNVPLVKKLFFKALTERPELRDLVGGEKPIATFGGFGNVGMPKSAVVGGRLYVGEAAGFQDPFRGFGMNYALWSGKLAADAITNSLDYDALWKKELMPKLKLDFARRFVMSIFGDRFVELAMKKYADGDTVDFDGFVPSNRFWYGLLVDSLCGMEVFKKRLTGYW